MLVDGSVMAGRADPRREPAGPHRLGDPPPAQRRLIARALGVVVISAAPLSQKRIEEFQPLRWLQKPFPIDALVRLLAEVEPARTAEVEPDTR